MKEFEKWDKRNKLNYGQFSGGEFSVKNERRKGWEAALEWVLSEIDTHDNPTTGIIIEEELEGE